MEYPIIVKFIKQYCVRHVGNKSYFANVAQDKYGKIWSWEDSISYSSNGIATINLPRLQDYKEGDRYPEIHLLSELFANEK